MLTESFENSGTSAVWSLKKSSAFKIILSAIFLANLNISAQTISKYEQPISPPVFFVASQDTFLNINEDSLIAASLTPFDTTIREGKSTTLAMLSSMVVPGLGQIYNESYWKAPVVWGLGYYFYSVYDHQDKLYREARSNYDTTVTLQNPAGNNSFRSLRDFYKNQRNIFGWYMVLTYLFNVLDAYVDAALYNFEVSPNLQGTNEWRLRMKIPMK